MSDNNTINEKLLKTYPVPVSIETTKKYCSKCKIVYVK